MNDILIKYILLSGEIKEQTIAYAADHIPQRRMKEYEDNLRNLAHSSTDSEAWAKRQTRMANLDLYELVKKLE